MATADSPKDGEPPLLEEVPDRAEESLVPLEKGEIDATLTLPATPP